MDRARGFWFRWDFSRRNLLQRKFTIIKLPMMIWAQNKNVGWGIHNPKLRVGIKR